MKKRVLTLFLALVLCLGLIFTAQAAEDAPATEWIVTEVVPCKYSQVEDFSEGLAAVVSDGKWGFIDKTGKEVITCKYHSVNDFSEGLAAVMLDSGEKDKWGQPIYKYGFVDKTGKEAIPCTTRYDSVQSFSEGLAAVCVGDYFGEGWGFIDKNGREVIPCKYEWMGWGTPYHFSEGLALVRLNSKYGFINTAGQEIVPCKYDAAYPFSEGFAAVQLQSSETNEWGGSIYKWGFIDKTGQEVVPCKYDYAESFSEGLAEVGVEGNYEFGDYKRGFIDKTGQEVVPLKYDWMYSESDEDFGFSDGLARVWLDDKYGFVDTTGREIIPCKYSWAENFSEGLAWVSQSHIDEDGDPIYRWGIVDKTGKEVIPCTLEYCSVYDFSGGFAAVCVGNQFNGGWGFVDKTGQEVVPCKYDYVQDFSEGLAAVELEGKWGFIALVPAVVHTGSLESNSGKSLDWTCSETGQVTVSGELAAGEKVLAASYDDQGRLTEIKQLTPNEVAQLKAETDKIKLFWLGSKQNPLSACATVWGE